MLQTNAARRRALRLAKQAEKNERKQREVRDAERRATIARERLAQGIAQDRADNLDDICAALETLLPRSA